MLFECRTCPSKAAAHESQVLLFKVQTLSITISIRLFFVFVTIEYVRVFVITYYYNIGRVVTRVCFTTLPYFILDQCVFQKNGGSATLVNAGPKVFAD